MFLMIIGTVPGIYRYIPGTENTNCDLKIRTYIRLRTDGTECTAPTVLYTKSVNGEK